MRGLVGTERDLCRGEKNDFGLNDGDLGPDSENGFSQAKETPQCRQQQRVFQQCHTEKPESLCLNTILGRSASRGALNDAKKGKKRAADFGTYSPKLAART